ncbi:MAG: orotidine-5'-phosphate decarboxylase [Candidatus Muiribacterium halophilum]|uniref:Orotidine 5'-phosphate decarboxylase n=1 Tax=Muiribacterium halophilum TaxID=2053465 RepID=A0A2N5ZML9_MUIH1|nr:MAG: orotidine-5'-phosphate decarboxylase [Candidatus Muirbacterium halophilum]
MNKTRLFVALDFNSREEAIEKVRSFEKLPDGYKIGLELYLTCGPSIVEEIAQFGDVFLDLKLHDIPNTMKKAAATVSRLPISILNIHACAGKEAMQSTLDLVREVNPAIRLIAVTVLTSMNQQELNNINVNTDPASQVDKLALLTKESGLDGVVCSPLEVSRIKQLCGDEFLTVVPGIRPSGSSAGDQKRIATPEQACKNGADIIICGRPIYNAKDPIDAIEKIKKELGG